jgi:hypothetical protein
MTMLKALITFACMIFTAWHIPQFDEMVLGYPTIWWKAPCILVCAFVGWCGGSTVGKAISHG